MIINRHNYEELFLLYVDDELNAAERKAVENFAEQNKDLAGELEMLKQATLADDNIKFEQKEVLYKKESGVSLANYEEYFLLSVDGELNEQEAGEVEKFVLQHPKLQQKFTQLKQTVSAPEAIAFPGKETLYRSEKKERRIIPIAWMRMSAAAIIAGLAITVWLFSNKGGAEGSSIVTATRNTVKVSSQKTDKSVPEIVTEKPVAALNEKSENKKDVKPVVTSARKTSIPANGSTLTKAEKAVVKKQIPNTQNVIADNNSIALVEKKAIQEQNNPDLVKVSGKNSGLKPDNNNFNEATLVNNTIKEQPVPVIAAVYREVDNNEEEKSLYIGSTEINKNKLKGLFKKATGFLQRKAGRKDDDGTM